MDSFVVLFFLPPLRLAQPFFAPADVPAMSSSFLLKWRMLRIHRSLPHIGDLPCGDHEVDAHLSIVLLGQFLTNPFKIGLDARSCRADHLFATIFVRPFSKGNIHMMIALVVHGFSRSWYLIIGAFYPLGLFNAGLACFRIHALPSARPALLRACTCSSHVILLSTD
jgi:hypothetical protein